MSFKRTKVVMLSTNEKASLKLGQNGLLVSNTLGYDSHFKNQELYFLSDEEIKEGDWCINLNSLYEHKELCRIDSQIELERYVQKTENDCKKIIATTKIDLDFQDYLKTGQKRTWVTLPHPSESFIKKFIEAYNGGKPITEVMVGDLQGQVSIRKLQKHLSKLPKKLSAHQMREVRARLKAVGGMSMPIPKGPLPKGVRIR